MTHEFISIIEQAHDACQRNTKCVLATIVHVDGSSYRREGTRMLMEENGNMQFELSGGCIEQEVFQHASSVFSNQIPKIIEYDGTIRLGCEGILQILLEPIEIDNEKYQFLQHLFTRKETFELHSFYDKGQSASGVFGTILYTQEQEKLALYNSQFDLKANNHYVQKMPPQFTITLFGSGQDVSEFAKLSSAIGWHVEVVLCKNSPKQKQDFPFANSVWRFEDWIQEKNNKEYNSAAVIMSHNFKNDKQYLKHLLQGDWKYIGIVGSIKRKIKFEEELKINIDANSDVYMPAGLDLGAVSPEEIALSITAEILTILRETSANHLRSEKANNLVS